MCCNHERVAKLTADRDALLAALQEIAGDSLAASDPQLVVDAMRITARVAIEKRDAEG